MATRSRGPVGKEMFGCGASVTLAADAVDTIRLPATSADACSRKVRRVIGFMVSFRGEKSIPHQAGRQMRFKLPLSAGGAKGFGAVGAGADAAEMVVTENAGGVAIAESDLDGVIAHGGSLLRARLGLKHRERGRSDGSRNGAGVLSNAFVIAGGAGTFFAKIGKIVVARVAVGPNDVDTRAAGYVNLYAGGLFSGIDGNGHDSVNS